MIKTRISFKRWDENLGEQVICGRDWEMYQGQPIPRSLDHMLQLGAGRQTASCAVCGPCAYRGRP